MSLSDPFENYFEYMDKLKEFETIRNNKGKLTCLLKNHPNAADYFYERSYGYLTLDYTESRYVMLSIASIDDSSLVFFGPTEGEQQGMVRIERILEVIKSWNGWIPTYEQSVDLEKTCGLYWNK